MVSATPPGCFRHALATNDLVKFALDKILHRRKAVIEGKSNPPNMRTKYLLCLALVCFVVRPALADDLTTLDGHTYTDIRDVSVKPDGLFFVVGDGLSVQGVIVAYTNLSANVREEYHCDSYELGLLAARRNETVNLNKNLAFTLDDLAAAEKKAKDEKKLLGFIMVWDEFFIPSRPMGRGSNGALAHFYDVFHDNLVLVFVRHERELGKVPEAVKQGFNGPEEGGYAPNMAVVTADGSTFVCEIPYADKDFADREQIFRQKITVIKKFLAGHADQ